MKTLTFVTLSLMLVFGIQAADQRDFEKLKFPELNPLNLPQVQQSQTANGIQLRLIKDDRIPMVDMTILVRGGSVYDPADKVGLADITAELLRIGGTAELKSEQLDQALDARGIDISISAENDYFSISLSCLKENFFEAVRLLAAMLTKPTFDPDKISEIKTKLDSVIARRNDQPAAINSREFNTLIYGSESPFGYVLEYEHLENISREDIGICYQKFFAPANMLAGVVGAIDLPEFQAVMEKYLAEWKGIPAIPPYPQAGERGHDFKVAFGEKANLNQSYISLGHLGPKFDANQDAKIMVFNQIFSQGMTSRLSNRIRTKMGLTYGTSGGITAPYLYFGKTYFTTFTKTESTLDAIQAITDEISIIRREKVNPEELSVAKDYFLNSFVFRFSTPERILVNELTREFYNLDQGYLKKLQENLKAVTADDILTVARQYLYPEKMIVFVLGPKGLEEKLAALGKVKAIDISIKPPAPREKIPEATPESLKQGKNLITQILNKKYGGLNKLKSLIEEGETAVTMPQGTISLKFKTSTLYPDKIHQEITMPFGKMEVLVNGSKGVQRIMGQEKPMTEAEIQKERFGELYDVFHHPDSYRFQYLNQTEINGSRYDVIYVFNEQKEWSKFYINRRSGLIEIEEKQMSLMGQQGIFRQVNSNFKTLNGISFPHLRQSFLKDKKIMESVVKEIKVNPPLAAELFQIK